MPRILKTASLPLDIAYARPEDNIMAVARALESIERDTDIVVLPELFSTGFIKKPDTLTRVAGHVDRDLTLAAMRRWASSLNMAVAGSHLVADEQGRYYNRGVFVEPDGETTVYDKRHLFTHSRENDVYTSGQTTGKVVRFRGWNVKLMICYDLRFPVWCRNRGLEYDLMLIPANWPAARSYAWKHLLIARAIENQACVVGANRGGSDPYGDYPASMCQAYNHYGEAVASVTPSDAGGWVYAQFDKDELDCFRRDFPVYLDADKYSI